MDRILHTLFHATFALIRAPLMMLLMASIVMSVVRHPSRQLAPVRARKPR